MTRRKNIFKRFYQWSLRKANPYNHKIKVIVSTYTGIAAVFLLFFKDKICSSALNFFCGYCPLLFHLKDRSQYSVDWITTIYTLLFIVWIYLYWIFVVNEKAASTELKTAILRAPNPNVFIEYIDTFSNVVASAQREFNSLPKKNRQLNRALAVQEILTSISDLTSTYLNHSNVDANFGTNVMLYLPYLPKYRLIFEWLQKDQKAWRHFKHLNPSGYVGVLRLIPDLSVREIDIETAFSLTLPVVHADTPEECLINNLPGAPQAIMLLDSTFFSNVRNFDAYKHLGVSECECAKELWKELKNVKSIYSLAIPYEWEDKSILGKIGVLNIDSSDINIFGGAEEFNLTFISLMYPILNELTPILREYYDDYINDLALLVAATFSASTFNKAPLFTAPIITKLLNNNLRIIS